MHHKCWVNEWLIPVTFTLTFTVSIRYLLHIFNEHSPALLWAPHSAGCLSILLPQDIIISSLDSCRCPLAGLLACSKVPLFSVLLAIARLSFQLSSDWEFLCEAFSIISVELLDLPCAQWTLYRWLSWHRTMALCCTHLHIMFCLTTNLWRADTFTYFPLSLIHPHYLTCQGYHECLINICGLSNSIFSALLCLYARIHST